MAGDDDAIKAMVIADIGEVGWKLWEEYRSLLESGPLDPWDMVELIAVIEPGAEEALKTQLTMGRLLGEEMKNSKYLDDELARKSAALEQLSEARDRDLQTIASMYDTEQHLLKVLEDVDEGEIGYEDAVGLFRRALERCERCGGSTDVTAGSRRSPRTDPTRRPA